MLASLIRWSIQNRFLVLMGRCYSPRGACTRPCLHRLMPYLTCPIHKSSFARSFPAKHRRWSRTSHLSLDHDHAVGAGARTVRGYSFFGDSYVYIIFDDKTDLYWARSRVLEYLSQVAGRLPPTAKPTWGLMYRRGLDLRICLVDHSGQYDISHCARCKIGS